MVPRSPKQIRFLDHAISDIRDVVPLLFLPMHNPMAVILEETRSFKCPLPIFKIGKENSFNLGFSNDNNMSNVCSNQVVTNTDEELNFLNNDDPVPVMNIFDSRTRVENIEY